ncbi:hypothetical protein CCYA_CCYA11G2991 [Cyanidiococcus yangmingshanensis]|uniref:S1 motif domain-containing protein n=1 Tax=Cyanidiococcus yangmingshanensis TaxID=2690220 RepID=A0A7J7II29_9RHOD|nr:hypothetical protein F1559_004328 [Cyanidiococcus yangmingshanensis]KAK4532134.1 hypothetical protein CCYA_CCYA11G2991 [Cyanidiococcus yangmingshanensis]
MFVSVSYTRFLVGALGARACVASRRAGRGFRGLPLLPMAGRQALLRSRAVLRMDAWAVASAGLPEEKVEAISTDGEQPAAEPVPELSNGPEFGDTTEGSEVSSGAGASIQGSNYGADGFRRRPRREGGFSRRAGPGGRRPASVLRRRPLEHKLTDLQPGQELRGTVCGVVSYGAFVDCGVYFEEEATEESGVSYEESSLDSLSTNVGNSADVGAVAETENLDIANNEQEAVRHEVEGDSLASSEVTDSTAEDTASRKRMVPFDGLVHVRDFSREYVESPESVVSRGDEVTVYVKFVDYERRRLSLSLLPPGQQRPQGKAFSSTRNMYTPTETAEGRRILTYADAENRRRVGAFELDESVEGIVRRVTNFGAFIDIGSEVDAFVHVSDLWGRNKQRTLQLLKAGDKLNAQVCEVNDRAKRIRVRAASPVGGESEDMSPDEF